MKENEKLKKIFRENWSSVFNTILGKEIKIDFKEIRQEKKSALLLQAARFPLTVNINYAEQENEKLLLLLSNKFVSVVANLMIGLDSFSETITADDRDAFSEAVNQMFAATQVPMLQELDLEMKFTNISFIDAAKTQQWMTMDSYQVWSVAIEFPEVAKEEFWLVAPMDFAVIAEEKKEEKKESAAVNAVNKKENRSNPSSAEAAVENPGNIDFLLDVELPITIRIGRTQMRLIDIMKLGLGSIIELQRMVDDPVDIMVNDKLVARGEVVVFDGNFGVRIIDVESKAERIKSLG